MEVRNFGRVWRSKIFRSEIVRQINEFVEFGKFFEVRKVKRFVCSGGLEGLGGQKIRQVFSPVINVYILI
jgi:hypothetical protein